MVIKGGKVYLNNDFSVCNVYIDNERIVASSEECDYSNVVDATDMYVLPGLVDIHLHGAVSYDFCDANSNSIRKILDYELMNGITAVCPTTMTYDVTTLENVFNCLGQYNDNCGADIIGINMEGPFIAKSKCGAQNEKYAINPDKLLYDRLCKLSKDKIKLCCIAPELEGAAAFINEYQKQVCISLAHTDADYDTAKEAFDKGVNHVTHLFNGMRGYHHREPGIIGAVSDSNDVFVELICDGKHINPSVVRATVKMLGEDRIVAISDSMRACGMEDGEYELGGQRVNVRDKSCYLNDGKTLAGSAMNLMDCFRILVKEMNIPLRQAIKFVSVNPAKSIGVENEYGSLEAGKYANIIIIDDEMKLHYIIKNGIIMNV